MHRLARALIAYTLSAALVAPQAFALPPAQALPAISVTKATTLAAGQAYSSPESALARLTPNVEPGKRARFLNEKRISLLKTGSHVTNEIIGFQAMLIMVAALSFQASNEHRQLVGLSNGQLPEGNSVQGDCTGTMMSALLCGGDFWLGMFGGAAFMGANSVAGMMLKSLIKEGGKRVAVFQLISALGSSALLMFGATSSSFVWMEAVKALPEADQIKKAEGVAGRALKAMASGNLAAFKESEDGKIMNAILENMWNILFVDTEMRSQWLFNTWRFGLARGEFVTAIATIMGATAAGTGAAALAVSVGITIPFLGFVVCAALGVVAMSLLLTLDAPKALTAMIQNLRSLSASSGMRRARNEIKFLTFNSFNVSRWPQADTEDYVKVFGGHLEDRLNWLQSVRERYANVMIEKYYELLNAQTSLTRNIEIAETAVRSKALQKNLFVSVGNEILSFEDAKKKLCTEEGRCDHSIAKQLEALNTLRPLVGQSQQRLTEITSTLAAEYKYDEQLIQSMWESYDAKFPVPVAMRLAEFQRRSKTVGEGLTIVLAGSDPVVAKNIGFEVTKEESVGFQTDLSVFYTQRFLEKKFYEAQKQVVGL